eukprot:TRINITY_DN3734_c0_g1_i4.p4 TRINITY_DN3734_c0_g1~~TRINITY_DN3734_c0_g1_i4.p4  ORF type:complete len:114 (+),score=4.28 TRINITY_DN3734_c0_g1_i4:393-734(+)
MKRSHTKINQKVHQQQVLTKHDDLQFLDDTILFSKASHTDGLELPSPIVSDRTKFFKVFDPAGKLKEDYSEANPVRNTILHVNASLSSYGYSPLGDLYSGSEEENCKNVERRP